MSEPGPPSRTPSESPGPTTSDSDESCPESGPGGSGSRLQAGRLTGSGKPPRKKRRFFYEAWKQKYPWVRYDEDENSMYCLWCTNTKQRSTMVFPGTKRLKICVLGEHVKTHSHKQAVEAKKHQNRTAQAILRELEQNDKGLTNMFRVMLYLSREDLAIMKFDTLCGLVQTCSAPMLNSYRNNHSGTEMLQCLAGVVRASIYESACKSPFRSLLIDESTDVSVHKQLIMYFRYIESSGPVTQFASLLQLEDASAVSIHTAVRRRLSEWNVDIDRLVGFASDGASVMTGRLNGVGARLKRDAKHLAAIHCVAHHLALASASATDEVPEVGNYENVIRDIYNYLAHSTNRRADLEFWQAVCEDPLVTMKSPSRVRWLSVHNSVLAVARSYTSLLVFLGMEAITSSAARGIYTELTQWRFAALTYIFNDVLTSLSTLSKKFQRDDLPLPRLLSLVETTRRELRACYLGVEGPVWGLSYRQWLAKFGESEKMGDTELVKDDSDKEAIQTVATNFVTSILQAFEERFPSSLHQCPTSA